MRLLLALALALPVSAQTVTRVSVSSSGQEGDGPTTAVTISESGRWVAMQSSATNLVAPDSNGVDDVFLHDRNWGTTTRISVGNGGGEANGPSSVPSISGSGARIAFESTATNLVGGYGPTKQIYVHDRVAGTTVAASAAAGNGPSSEAQISLDGQWVVFQSDATNLVGGDANGATDVFLAEVVTGATTRVSVASSGTEGNGASTRPSVSADGRWVAFVSSASNLVPGDTNGVDDLFLHDTLTGQTTRVSMTSGGAQANGQTVAGTISPDGGYVALASDASNLVFGDTNGVRDIFVKVLGSGLAVRASVSSSGTQSSASSFFPSVSWYGSEVSFHTLASLVPGDTNGQRDVYKHSLDTGLTTLVSATASGGTASGTSWLADLDTGGRVTVFQSDASDLVAGDTNGVSDAFVQLQKATWYIDVAGAGSGTGTPGNPYTSIQYAIDRPQTVGGDELLVAAGTYYENVDLRGKPISLRSLAGSSSTIIDGGAAGSVVFIADGGTASTSIEGFTLTNGTGTYDPVVDYFIGGGLGCHASTLSISECVITLNRLGIVGSAGRGAGIYIDGSNVTLINSIVGPNPLSSPSGQLEGVGIAVMDSELSITGCEVVDNDSPWTGGSTGRGGGIYIRGSNVSIADSMIRGNHGDADGGGIYQYDGNLTVADTVIQQNTGYYGGGVHLSNGTAMFLGCWFDQNLAPGTDGSGYGGGIFGGGGLAVKDCVLSGNRASKGGALSAGVGALVDRCSFIGNVGSGDYGGLGGAVYAWSGFAIDDSVFDGNFAESAGYFGHHGHAVYGPAVLRNCTVASFPPIPVGQHPPQAGVWGAVLENCVLWGGGAPEIDNSTATYSNILGGYPGTGNLDEDPLFWDPEGGDFRLRPGSPCIDAGDPTSPLDPDGSIADMGVFPFDPDYCPTATSYCTAGTTGNGCMATISATGTPGASASSGFDVVVTNVEGQKQGIIFWGRTGKAAPWGGGSSWLCVQAPAKRTGTQDSGGTAGQCDGSFSLDFNAWMAANPGKAPGLGEVVYMQAWFRDPPSPKTTSLSDGLRFVVCE